MHYKVVRLAYDLTSDVRCAEFEALLNEHANEGYKLDRLITQNDESGVYCNVAVFIME